MTNRPLTMLGEGGLLLRCVVLWLLALPCAWAENGAPATGPETASVRTLTAQVPAPREDAPAVNPAASQSPERQNWDAVNESYQVVQDRLKTIEDLRTQLKVLAERRQAIESETAYIKSKVQWARTRLAGAGAADNKDATYIEQREKWLREVKAWEARDVDSQTELTDLARQEEALLAALREAAKGPDAGAKDILVPGETIELAVVEDDSLNGLYQVRRGGYIILPRVGRIFVAGKALAEVEQAVKTELEATQLRLATVMVERAQGFASSMGATDRQSTDAVIYISGEVMKSGPWPIPRGFRPTLVTTLLRFGGLKDTSDLEHVKVLRMVEGRALVEEVNVRDMMSGAGLTADYALQSDDIITIPPIGETSTIYLTGLVKKPGMVTIAGGKQATLASVLLKAGGVVEDQADLEKVRVLRVVAGQAVVHEVNVQEVLAGDKPETDFALQPDDIVTVPSKGLARRVFLTGSVAHPGFVELRAGEDTSLYATVIRAGGFGRFANLKKSYVLRDMGDGLRTRIPVDLKLVREGSIPDLILENNDIVVVPEKFFSF